MNGALDSLLSFRELVNFSKTLILFNFFFNSFHKNSLVYKRGYLTFCSSINMYQPFIWSRFFHPYLAIEIIIEHSVTISSRIPAQEPTMMSYMIHNGEFTHIPTTLTVRALCVYPPIVAAMFAATGKTDIHPDHVKVRATI